MHPIGEGSDCFRSSDKTELDSGCRASGAKVVVSTEVYPRYLFADSDHETDCENRSLRRAAAASAVQLVDLQSYICPNGKCRDKQDGATLRPDGEHYDGRGGKIVAQWLLDQVR